MKNAAIFSLTACLLVFFSSPVAGFSTHATIVYRVFDSEKALVGEPITVTVSFLNLEPNDLRGLYYTEQIPFGLFVNTVHTRIAGENVSFTQECGVCGEIYNDYTPHRWILELPPSFAENNPVSQDTMVEIVYTVTSSDPGVFSLDEFSWVGLYQNAPAGLRTAFGYSQPQDQQPISFVSCLGNFDDDNDIDWNDLEIFVPNFGEANCDQGEICEGDFEPDGDMDGSDLAIFANEFGETDCP